MIVLHVLKIILTVLLVLGIFNLMIVVHELGHFLAGKWRGLVIEEFGIWFGKPIWRKKFGDVWYSLGSIPAGGFVKLPQMAAMDSVEGKSETPVDEMPRITPKDKIIVAAAGPLFSFLLAVVFAVIVWQVGRPVSDSEITTTIGYVMPGSPAAEAKLQPGDKILSIDGHDIHRWAGMGSDSIIWRIVSSENETLDMRIERDGKVLEVHPHPQVDQTKFWNRKGLRQLKIEGASASVVGQIDKDGPAALSGLEPGDRLEKVNGQPIYHFLNLLDYVKAHPGEPLVFTAQRAKPGADGKPVAPKNVQWETIESKPISLHAALIGDVLKESPAAAAGLLPKDRVVAINGTPYSAAQSFTDIVKANGAKPLVVDIERGGKPQQLTITPAFLEGQDAPRIGVSWFDDLGFELGGVTELAHPSPVEQVRRAAMSIFETVGAVASRKSGIKLQHMGGPVMMVHTYYTLFQIEDGWRLALWFSVVLNVNLALLNLLPIPVLDGGHITLALLEAIRRKPLNIRVVEYVTQGCFILIFGFMIFIFFFDVQDLFPKSRPKFSSTPAASAPAATPAAVTK